MVVEQAEAGASEAEGRERRFMEARGLVGRDRDAVLDDEQFGRVGGNLVFRQANPPAGGERSAEARFGEFFRDRLPSERLRFRDREGERNGRNVGCAASIRRHR